METAHYPSGQIEEDYDDALLFSKYLCEGNDRSFSLIRERLGIYSYMHSISDTWWSNGLNKDGLVLHCKEPHLEAVSACFLMPCILFAIAKDPTRCKVLNPW